MEDGQDHILEKLGTVFRGTVNGEMPHLRSLKLKGGALTYVYVCADQQSGQWLIRATRLGPGVRLKACARNLPKPVKVVLRIGT
jgi:hypothetical protein